MSLEKLRYPIGRFEWKPKMSEKSFEFQKKNFRLSQRIGEQKQKP